MFERLFLNLEGPGAFRVLQCASFPISTQTLLSSLVLTDRCRGYLGCSEPGGDSWYFGPERSSQRYSAEHCAQEYPQYKDVTVAKVCLRFISRSLAACTACLHAAAAALRQPSLPADLPLLTEL